MKTRRQKPYFNSLIGWLLALALLQGCGIYKSQGRKDFEDTPLSQLHFLQTSCTTNFSDNEEDYELNWNSFTAEYKNQFVVISEKPADHPTLGPLWAITASEPESKVSCELNLQ